jgi:hypothetical protein
VPVRFNTICLETMLRFSRFILSALSLALILTSRAGAQPSASSAAPAAATSSSPPSTQLPPDLQAELDALQRGVWVPSATLRGSLGWRDNVLLSPFAPIERAFGRAELEAILLRPMRHRWEFLSFLNGDVLRYFSPPPETGGEQQWSLHSEARWQPLDPLRFSLKATGYLRDMVIDLSETEATRVVAPTRVRGAYATAVTRVALPGGFSVEPLVQVKRTDYRDYPGDYDEVRAGGRLEWRRTNLLALSAAWFESDRDYSQRPQYSASGRALAGTRLSFRVRDAELKARSAWNAGGDWTAAATIGRVENRDDASGYFNYDQKRARLELGWHRAAWRVGLDGETKHMVYLVQTVGAGIAPAARVSDDHEGTLRVERELDARWTLFFEHHWERSRSNLTEFNYRANTALAGVQRSF